MIDAYKPTALIRAAEEVRRAHPLREDDSAEPLSEEALGLLVRDIAGSAKANLTLTALSVSPRQLRALCQALPKLKKADESENVAYVLNYNMNAELFETLFAAWQTAPLSEPLLKLLADHEDGKDRPKEFPFPRGSFTKLLTSLPRHDEYIRAVSKTVLPVDISGDTLFADRYRRTGLRTGTTLYAYCFISHLTECTAVSFEAEGDEAVSRAIALAGKTRSAESIIQNLLTVFADDTEGLLAFNKCYALISERFGYPDRAAFSGSAPAFRSYQWWYRYHLLASAFEGDSDSKRRLFWTHYLSRCDISLYPKQQLIALAFRDYTVIESLSTGPLYIYDNDYFASSVKNRLNSSRASVKNWIGKSSKYVYSLSHALNWESRVQENASQYLT